MKKLQLKNDSVENRFSVQTKCIDAIIIKDGFSGFEINHKPFKGACCGCTSKTCASYSEEEIYSEIFSAFPKNPSKRVCPTDAITFKNGYAYIDSNLCIKCGLCVHRCPYAAIQFSLENNTCSINTARNSIFIKQSEIEQTKDILDLKTKPRKILIDNIPFTFADTLSKKLETYSNRYPDLSEIVVRNTLLNLGICCNTNAEGNNHNRIEFFAECEDYFIIGESQISNADTLSVTRRILDDLAVLISRYQFEKDKLIPLAVVNGFPNKRTDFYEVIEDINNVIKVQVVTLSYHALFVLNLFKPHISVRHFKSFVINRTKDSLLSPMKRIIEKLEDIDENTNGIHYTPIK